MTVKSFLLLSSLGLVLTAQAQDCTAPPIPENMSLRDNDIGLTDFPDGTKIGYVCSIGYTSAGGSSIRVCSAGSWSPLALKCERKNCGSAGEVLNGDVDYPQGTLFGDTAVVVCNNGYVLVGKSKINCGDQGWMERLPYCEVIACDPPGQITDGTFSPEKDSYEYRDVVIYTCSKGLTLKGLATLSCSEDGTFTPALPTCEKIECDKPDIPFAQRLGGYLSTYKYKDTVRHECIAGYERIGDSSSVCEINGEWVPKLMTCKAKNCTTPVGGSFMSLRDKEIVSQTFLHDTDATFVCNAGYEPAGGSGVIKCTAGKWSPLTLNCKPYSCSKPIGGSNMSLDKSSVSETFPHDTSATFVCNDGFEPESGSGDIKCTTGNWSLLTLKCKTKDCTTPVGKNNMRLSDKDSVSKVFPHDTSATFVCDDGYELDSGSGDIKCTTGDWSPLTLKCKKKGSGGGGGDGGDGGGEGNAGNNTGRNVGIAVAVIAVVAALICGGIFYKKKKKQGFHKGNPENGTTGDEGASMQLT